MSQDNTPIVPPEVVDPMTHRPVTPPLQQGEPIPQREKALDQIGDILKQRRTLSSLPLASVPDELVKFIQAPLPVHTFPEPLFVQYFLPLFAGNATEDHAVSYQTWIEKVAGSDRSPVDIVDGNGKVLFRVPPLMDVSALEMNKSGRNWTILERQYFRMKEVDAQGSQDFLATSLSSLHIAAKAPDELYQNTRAWNEIFRRYGMEDKILNLVNEEDAPESVKNENKLSRSNDRLGEGELEFD